MKTSKLNLNINLIKLSLLTFLLTVGIAMTGRTMIVCAEEYSVNAVTGEGTIDADSLNFRSGPGKDYDSLGTVKKGASVEITGESDGWYRIDYDGKTGFVSAQYVDVSGELTETSDEGDSDTDDKSDKKSEAEKEDTLEDVGEPEEGSFVSRYKVLLVIPLVLVILGVVIAIIFTLRRGDEDYDDYDDGYDDDYDDGYDDYDEYDDDYDDYDEYDDDYYDDDYDDNDDYYDDDYDDEPDDYEEDYDEEYDDEYEGEEENRGIETPRNDIVKKETRRFDGSGDSRREAPRTRKGRREESLKTPQKKEVVIRVEDFQLDIDPKFFDTQTIIEQPEAVTGYIPGQMDREEKISMVESEISRLQEEVDKLKQESENAKAENGEG